MSWECSDLADIVLDSLDNNIDEECGVLSLTYWQKMEICYILANDYIEQLKDADFFDARYKNIELIVLINSAIEVSYDHFVLIIRPHLVRYIYEILAEYGIRHEDYLVRGRWYYSNYYDIKQ